MFCYVQVTFMNKKILTCYWFLQFNTAAKQLIELDKPSGSAVDSGEGTSGAAHNNSTQKHTDTKKNTKKRHSFTSLTMSNKASQSSQNRHSMEISPPVLISSSNPTAAARISELTGLSCSAPSQVIHTKSAITIKASDLVRLLISSY